MRFQDRIALITAAASGIGRATADIMAREGAVVIAVDNNEERLDRTVAELRAAGGTAHRRLCNALDEADVSATVASVLQEFGRIDILVNAVGGSTIIPKPGAPVEELSFADWQKLIDFNLSGTFLFTHEVVPAMKQRRRGAIVNLASIAGRGLSISSSSAYAAAKGGVIAFTKSIARENARFGVTANCVAPGPIDTPMLHAGMAEVGAKLKDAVVAATLLKRLGTPDEVAAAVAFLTSDEAGYITGETIGVSGGMGLGA